MKVGKEVSGLQRFWSSEGLRQKYAKGYIDKHNIRVQLNIRDLLRPPTRTFDKSDCIRLLIPKIGF